MRKYIFIAIAFTIFAVEAKSQKTKGSIDSLKIAEAFIENENFVQAIEFYKKFLRNDAENPELNFKLGFCILNTGNGKEKAIPYLEKAVKAYNKKEGNSGVSYIESKFYLARTYRAIYKFDTAIVLFEELKTIVKSKSVLKEIEDELNLCNTGKELYKNKVGVTITNMGPTINSEFSDHSPVFSADESLLIFTSRRKHDPIPGTDPEESDDGQYDEDIYKSEKIEGVWTTPVSIGPNINTYIIVIIIIMIPAFVAPRILL